MRYGSLNLYVLGSFLTGSLYNEPLPYDIDASGGDRTGQPANKQTKERCQMKYVYLTIKSAKISFTNKKFKTEKAIDFCESLLGPHSVLYVRQNIESGTWFYSDDETMIIITKKPKTI